MSLFESKESKGVISLADLFNGKTRVSALNEGYGLKDTAFYICRGGWPMAVAMGQDRDRALKITKNYYSTLLNFENSKNKKFRNKKPAFFRLILRSYARNISTEARMSTILNDINAHEGRNISEQTLEDYLRALNDLYILKDLEAGILTFEAKP